MHLVRQAVSVPGQLQLPPGPEHVSPVTVQSPLLQHDPIGMHALLVGQNFWPAAQLQEPPGPEQLVPPPQSAFVQHSAWVMHWLKGGLATVQTLPPLEHVQLPPGPEHASPVTRQSLVVQHVLVGMHALLTVHTLALLPQLQVPPGVGQVEPVMLLQSELSQQLEFEMQALFATHA
jgi:hypothetical protein